MGLDARKPVFSGLRTTQAQTSLRIRAVWSAPLLFAFWKVSYVNLLQVNFNFLASLCSWGGWFESRFVGNPEDEAQMITVSLHQSLTQMSHQDHSISTIRGKFNNASAVKRSLYWCQALHNMNKDRYQSTSARRALALLNSPQNVDYSWRRPEINQPWHALYVFSILLPFNQCINCTCRHNISRERTSVYKACFTATMNFL